jgi:hypothetical protein
MCLKEVTLSVCSLPVPLELPDIPLELPEVPLVPFEVPLFPLELEPEDEVVPLTWIV